MQGRSPRPRRTQEERSAATRQKVIEAAIECIAEEGFRRATTTRVARRAGVTWGAIQHQFGDKDSILRAVMQRGVEELRDELKNIPADPPLRERVHLVIRRIWDVFNRPFYRAFLEVALATREGAGGSTGLSDLLEEITQLLGNMWIELFPAGEHSSRRAVAAQRLAIHALSGMAQETLLRSSSQPQEDELELLEEIVYGLLTG
jgi:AcrR family transcriptional regulator